MTEDRRTGAKIPNFNTLSTLIDRLTIENVKLAHFENALEHDGPTGAQRIELERKIAVQHEVIQELKKEIVAFLEESFVTGRYEYLKEERTFA